MCIKVLKIKLHIQKKSNDNNDPLTVIRLLVEIIKL